MLLDDFREMFAFGIGINGPNARGHEAVSQTFPAFDFISATNIVAIERSNNFAPFGQKRTGGDASGDGVVVVVEGIEQGHDRADCMLIRNGCEFGGVAFIGNAKRTEATVGPRLLGGPGCHFAHVRNFSGGVFNGAMAAGAPGPAGINPKDDEVTLGEVKNLFVEDFVGSNCVESEEHARCPTDLWLAPVTRRAHEDWKPFIGFPINRKVDAHGYFSSVAHLDVGGTGATEPSWRE